MRAEKPGDSPSGYTRDVYRRRAPRPRPVPPRAPVHAYASPVVHPYDHSLVVGFMDVPGGPSSDFPGATA